MNVIGTVCGVRDGTIEAVIPSVAVGDGVRVDVPHAKIDGIVTAVRGRTAIVAPHASVDGVAAGDRIALDPAALMLPLGTALLGRAIDAGGNAIDGKPLARSRARAVLQCAPRTIERAAVAAPFWTGVRAIDGLLTVGRGARIGIFGSPGTGKSTLLETCSRSRSADAVVIGLIGERGREAHEWMRYIQPNWSIVCATSDRSAAERVRAGEAAMAQALSLCERGLHVLLILDSLARYAAALRELGVASNESAGRGGYPPSVFAKLARLLERAGPSNRGSVTLMATVLGESDGRDPVSEAARSLLDGHIELSAVIASKGRFPAFDVCASTSRTMPAVAAASHLEDAAVVRRAVAALQSGEEARALGIMPADAPGLRAVAAEDAISNFLCQGKRPEAAEATLSALSALADRLR